MTTQGLILALYAWRSSHAASIGPLLSLSSGLLVPVTSGVLVAAIVGGARMIWVRRRIPTALSRAVRRETYLSAVLAESQRDDVVSLDVLAPRLTPAAESPLISRIQKSWQDVNSTGAVRALILDSDECIKGGAELLSAGIEVRVGRRVLGAEDLSYHIFDRKPGEPTAIVNHHVKGGGKRADQPVRLSGTAPTQIFREHFASTWQISSPLEAVIADKIVEKAHESTKPRDVLCAVRSTQAALGLSEQCIAKVLPHVAFRSNCPVVFIVGLPGAGKSYVRGRLAAQLADMGINSRELSDYVYAYRDFLHGLTKLEPYRGAGYKACPGGAFAVTDERALRPALQALAQAVTHSSSTTEVTLAEFARSDTVSALCEFDDLGRPCHVIYVQAPADLRSARLNRRAEPPASSVDGISVTFVPSDNHPLPSTAERALYACDDFNRLASSPRWRNHLFRIDNDVDDGGTQVQAGLSQFIAKVIEPYRAWALPEKLGTNVFASC